MSVANQVTIIGNVGADPQLKGKTKSDQAVVSFAVAQSNSSLDPITQERIQKEPQWFQISCFSVLAEKAVASLKKGDLVLVFGELKSRNYISQDGKKRNSVEIAAQEIFHIERLKKATQAQAVDSSVSDEIPDFSTFMGSGVDL